MECPICLGVPDPFLDGLPCEACGGEPRMSPDAVAFHRRCLEEPGFEQAAWERLRAVVGRESRAA